MTFSGYRSMRTENMKEIKKNIEIAKKIAEAKFMLDDDSQYMNEAEHVNCNFEDLDSKYSKYNVEENWNKFNKRKSFLRVNKNFIYGLAANIAVLFAIGFLIYSNYDEIFHPTKLVNNNEDIYEIKPTKNTELRLGDGSIINLDMYDSEEVIMNDSIKITNSNKELKYKAKENSVPEMNEVFVPKGQKLCLHLSDGTKVWLNSYTKFVYPTVFKGSTREVYLNGEAYFDVKTNKSKAFIVNTVGMNVKVLGTKFNVSCYVDKFTYSKTTLIEGKVKISKEKKSKILKPGQQAKCVNSDDIGENSIWIKDVNPLESINWLNGILSFKNSSLEEIFNQLSREYNYEFVVSVGVPFDQSYTAEINKPDDIKEVLDALELLTNASFEIKDRVIYVDYKRNRLKH